MPVLEPVSYTSHRARARAIEYGSAAAIKGKLFWMEFDQFIRFARHDAQRERRRPAANAELRRASTSARAGDIHQLAASVKSQSE